MPFDVITIGSATRDVFMFTEALHPHRTRDVTTHTEACFPLASKIDVENIHFDTGGGATNSATTFSRLGRFKVAALTSVGNDSRGHSIIAGLRGDHINTNLIQMHRHTQTAFSVALSPAKGKGERTIFTHRGASSHFALNKIPWTKLQARWFYITSLGGNLDLLKRLISHAERIKAQVCLNPGKEEIKKWRATHLNHRVAIFMVNREEAAELTRLHFGDTKKLLHALALIAPLTIMTDGPKGAYAVTSRQPTADSRQPIKPYAVSRKLYAYYVPSVGHKPASLTGAGDAFGSGFVTGWIKSRGDIKYALRLASFNADSVVQHIGAKVGILNKYPSESTLDRLPIKTLPL